MRDNGKVWVRSWGLGTEWFRACVWEQHVRRANCSDRHFCSPCARRKVCRFLHWHCIYSNEGTDVVGCERNAKQRYVINSREERIARVAKREAVSFVLCVVLLLRPTVEGQWLQRTGRRRVMRAKRIIVAECRNYLLNYGFSFRCGLSEIHHEMWPTRWSTVKDGGRYACRRSTRKACSTFQAFLAAKDTFLVRNQFVLRSSNWIFVFPLLPFAGNTFLWILSSSCQFRYLSACLSSTRSLVYVIYERRTTLMDPYSAEMDAHGAHFGPS